MIRKPTAADFALILVMVSIWSSAFVAIKVAVVEVGPFWLVVARVGFGFLALLPWTLWRGIVLPASRQEWLYVVLVALLSAVVPFLLISWAQLTISAGLTALLMGTGPFLGLLLSHVTTTDDRLNVPKLVAVLLGFTGVALVVGPEARAGFEGGLAAPAAVICACACYAVAGTLVRRIDSVPPTRLTSLVLGIALVVLAPVVAWRHAELPAMPDGTALLSMVWLGVGPTGLAYLMRYHLIRAIGYSYVALGLNLLPACGVAMGALLLGEPVSLTVLAALLLVLAGLAVARIGAGRAAVDL
ncbi:DMT family transporter [Microbaculum marinum]|uniref:DMT family transporter n=1 Tax=Microbaculum marinum TaxID=1764581 RepID=A0AAW9RS43_9HYPH